MLNREERNRYDRQLGVQDFGEEGQEKLKRAKVFISGLGGLGSPIALYLAAAGVGTLHIVDEGEVELSNLNRQILYGCQDIGRKKAAAAKQVLEGLNPCIKIEPIVQKIDASNAMDMVGDSDAIIDALDNYATRYILNRASLEKRIPFFFGAVKGFQGMVTTLLPGKTGCLRCMVPYPPPVSLPPVIGVTPAVIGCIQATEAIKYITGIGQLLADRLLLFDGMGLKFSEMSFRKNPNCLECGKKDEEYHDGDKNKMTFNS